MEATGHFIFELFKIAVLSGIYAWLLLLVFKVFAKPEGHISRLTSNKLKFWKATAFKIACVLLVYMLTPWGNHGFGDSARIPIGHFKAVTNVNWTPYAYLKGVETTDGMPIVTTLFTVAGHKVLGNLNSDFYSYKNNYFVYDLSSGKLREFASEDAFNIYSSQNQLPQSGSLKTFSKNYKTYWHGWRLWLLP